MSVGTLITEAMQDLQRDIETFRYDTPVYIAFFDAKIRSHQESAVERFVDLADTLRPTQPTCG